MPSGVAWTKFPDGTLIQSGSGNFVGQGTLYNTVQSLNLFRTGSVSVQMPIGFVGDFRVVPQNTEYTTATINCGGAFRIRKDSQTAFSVQFVGALVQTELTSIVFDWIAIGRWK